MTTSSTAAPRAPLRRTPLYDLHLELGAKMVPFAGYDMPVQYPAGLMAEHRTLREAARPVRRLAHGPAAPGRRPDAAAALETLVPVDVVGLAPGKQRYALFTNDAGGILDDLMVANRRRRPPVPGRQRRPARTADIAHLRPTIAAGCAHRAAARPRAAGAAGPAGRR